MAQNASDPRGVRPSAVLDLAARAAAAETHADALRDATARDFAIPEALRLDERTRSGIALRIESIITSIEAGLLHAVAPLGFPGIGPTLPLLRRAGLAADAALVGEVLAQVRLDQLAQGLPHHAPRDPARPSLLGRLAEHPVEALAGAARSLMVAESSARSPEAGHWQLPRDLHRQLLWWVAAAMREQAGTLGGVALDEALCAAVAAEHARFEQRAQDQPEAASCQLVALLAPAPRERAAMLVEALADRRLPLFLALIAQAGGIAFADARALVLDPGAERLLLVLHALAIPRDSLAQIGFLLCDADPGRDLPALVDALDALDAQDFGAGRDLLARLRLDAGYRAARSAIGGARAATP